MHAFVRLLKVLLLLFMLFILLFGGYVAIRIYPEFQNIQKKAIDTYSRMSEEDFRLLTDTEIFDSKGKKIGAVNAGHFTYVPFDEISPWLKKAYIAQEDRRFYSHRGIDFMAMTRAAFSYVKKGRITQGGSTITQQVVKNAYLTQERTLERKLTELLIAPRLEAKFDKDKILEFYCNGNFYGHGCYGVGAASRYYFGKSAHALEPWEAAVLVGISNRPARYEPVNHPAESKKKRDEVLYSMYVCGDISKKELDDYRDKPLTIIASREESANENYQTSYAIFCAAQQLMKNDGFQFEYTFASKKDYQEYQTRYREAFSEKSESIRAGGYQIYTTLDSAFQDVLQNEIDRALDARSDERQENGKYALQGAGAVVDNASASVVAIVGGRGTEDVYNRAFLSMRQPGSVIKPLLDYAPAFETGYFYPSYLIDDHEFENGPKNAGGNYYGSVSLREALNRSLNTVAWQLLRKIGIKTGLSYLEKMEFSSLTFEDGTAPAISIGGFTLGTRVVEMAKGYATLANGGVYDEKTCLTSLIYEQTGEELLKNPAKKKRVFTEGSAFLITDILKGTMDKEYGTGRGLDLPGQEAAGKTGTANGSKDTWFCGYTKYYSCSIWIGYDTPRVMPGIYGATVSGRIWKNVMEKFHQDLPVKDWVRPSSVVLSPVDYSTGVRTDNDTGSRDYFNDAVDPAAKSKYESANGTSKYDPAAYRTNASDLTEESDYEENEAETVIEYEYATGVDGGPGVTMPVTKFVMPPDESAPIAPPDEPVSPDRTRTEWPAEATIPPIPHPE